MEPPDRRTRAVGAAGSRGPGTSDPLGSALATLSGDQRRAVESPSPALCVVAGAGSGKTRVLTLRVARRISDGSAEADHTAVCTFTRRAADELRRRLGRYGVPVSVPVPGGGAPTPGVRAGTLHQLALGLLRRHALDEGEPPPFVVEQRYRIVAGLVDEPAAAAAAVTEIGWAKSRGVGPAGYAGAAREAGRHPPLGPDRTATIYDGYERALGRRRALDLDDVLVRAADLLHDDGAVARAVRWRYRHLAVDEFQDVNPAQYRLLRTLLGDGDDLCVIGDPHQAIYGWNGADPQLLARLPGELPGMEVVRLDTNHRSSPQVVAAAAAVLGPDAGGRLRSAAGEGPLPVVTAYESGEAEVDGVVSHLVQRAADGLPWGEQAVLARTRDQLVAVARALDRAGVPCHRAPAPEVIDAGRWGPASRTGYEPRRAPADGDAVELATFHRAKGLEWTSVHVLGVEDGYVPVVHATSDTAREEERRLLYVALSRAGRELHCSWARRRRVGNGREVDRRPSPWLAAVREVAGSGGAADVPTPRHEASRRVAALREQLRR